MQKYYSSHEFLRRKKEGLERKAEKKDERKE